MRLILGFGLILAAVTSASAQQGYVITNPNGTSTFVARTPNGGLMATAPNGQHSYANPLPNGGYIVNTPGTPGSTYVRPTPGLRSASPSFGDDD